MATNYANDVLTNISNDGMTDELWHLVHNDVDKLSQVEVNNHRERNLYFYLEHFIDDLCDEFKCSVVNKDEIVAAAFKELRNKDKIDLTDIRRALFNVIRKTKKVAYPNIKGTQNENVVAQYDVDKWINTLSNIYAAVRSGESRTIATEQATEGWSPMEKYKFENWVRYYEHGDHEKYGLQKSAAGTVMPVFPKREVGAEEPDELLMRRPGRPRQTVKTLEQEKQSLISRLDSATKILRKFVNVWPPEKWQRFLQMLADLQGEILQLKTTATMVDCIVKTANKLNKAGFVEGAETLIKIAQPPSGDIANKIERALSGKNPDEAGGDLGAAPAPGGDLGAMPSTDMPPMPPGGGADMMPQTAPEMAPPAGVEGNLPEPEAPPAPPPTEETPTTGNNENPFEGKQLSVKDVLDVLEPLAKQLSEREFVRALSKVDMMLDSMNIASHFPELGEAQSKALELNIYVGKRVSDIIDKLKGGLKEEKEDKDKESAGPPAVDMGEFAGGPSKEKEMFEVGEEPAPTAPVPTPPVTPGV